MKTSEKYKNMNCDKNLNFGSGKTPEPNPSRRRFNKTIPILVSILLNFFYCGGKEGTDPLGIAAIIANQTSIAPDPGEAFSGGYGTRFISNPTSFDTPFVNLSSDGIKFNTGNNFFNRAWVAEGNSASSGLGPTFNTSSCQNCHASDGRGAPPSGGGTLFSSVGILIRLSKVGVSDPTTGGPVGLDSFGLQLNHKGIGCTSPFTYDSNFDCNGTTGANFTPPEGTASVSYTGTPVVRNYTSGGTVTLNTPVYSISWNVNFGGAPSSFNLSPRTAPMIPGLGLLEAIPESTILGWADPTDSDGDGISGKVNMVWDAKNHKKVMGRFGWKANEPSLFQQNQGAFLGDIGITSPLFSTDNCPSTQTQCLAAASGTADPEITASIADSVNFYTRLVAVPARRNLSDQDVIDGKAIFSSIKCDACHKPFVLTGNVPGLPELSFQYIKPYTDLLLHDMGPDLADGRPDFDADGQEWRTPPLWGLGLIQEVNGHLRLMHDGRANGIEEAILWHGGEADTARNGFQNLSLTDRQKLIKFLESL
ncbi:di-heme oxidoredictase family protein [Leptospira venezuelensis]|nr:di-heme oxidoredictase family protein [Leptospira venezuelensis]